MKQNMRQKNMQAYLFLSPFLVFIPVSLYILPAILAVIVAFTSLDSAFIWKFNGIDRYREIAHGPECPHHRLEYSKICGHHHLPDGGVSVICSLPS